MAFQITQCPSCNSTFNTSPQMLEMAGGKVRCGACLTVFQAQEHFVEVDTGSHADEADESVFIGNDPEDFFDPTVFLTRSALQDDHKASDQTDLISPAAKAKPETLVEPEELETRGPDSNTTISAPQAIAAGETANSMDNMAAPLALGNDSTVSIEPLTATLASPTPQAEISQAQSDQPDTVPHYFASEAKEHPGSEHETGTETETRLGVEAEATTEAQNEAEKEVEEDTTIEIEENTEPQLTAETGTETEHAEFFAALEESLDGLEATDELVELKAIAELDALSSASEAVAPMQLDENTAIMTPAESEAEASIEDYPAGLDAADPQIPNKQITDETVTEDSTQDSVLLPEPEPATPASAQRPEDVSLSISFSVQPPSTALSTKTAAEAVTETPDQADHTEQLEMNQDTATSNASLAGSDSEAPSEPSFSEPELDPTTEFSEKTVILESENIRAAEMAEQDFNDAIKEQEFADTVASGFAVEESMDSDLDSSMDWQLASVEDASGEPQAIEDESNEQNQDSLLEPGLEQSSEHDPLNPGEDELLEDLDAASTNSGSPILEQDDSAQYPDTDTAGPPDKSTEGAEIESPALTSSDENADRETSESEASPGTMGDHPAEQLTDAAVTQYEQGKTQDSAAEIEAEVSSEDIRARAMRAQLQDEDALEQLPEENLAALKVMATPLELGSGQGRRWGATLGLALLACVLGAGIAGQYLWRHNTVYSQQAILRPLFATSCQILGCTLEPYRDLSAIVSSNLSVRSHPERADAIMVNVEVRNTAPFEQPFPIMVLGFNTASNDLVALREFTPDEYLASGLRDVTQMPVMAPVQIDLALMDPGDDAVNYTLAFRLP